MRAELAAAAAAESRGHFATAFGHLERAHVLGQASTRLHLLVHWRMFRYAVRNGFTAEARGQFWRTWAPALCTPFDLVPSGNTGGTNVGALRRMPIPQDLQHAIDDAAHD